MLILSSEVRYFLRLNELSKKLRTRIILGNFLNQTVIDLQFSENVFQWSKVNFPSRYIFFDKLLIVF